MSALTIGALRIIALTTFLLIALALAAFAFRRRRMAARLGDAPVLRQLIGGDPGAVPGGRIAMVALAALGLSLALLDPNLAKRPAGVTGPIVLLLDASGSMLVNDVGPRRLDLQREIAEDFVSSVPDLPIGVVAFAGRAFSLTPPTRDRDAVAMYLGTLDPTIVTQSGSALDAALRQGISLLAASASAGGRAGGTILLFGDGDETGDPDAALAAAELAGDNGIAVHVIGIGTDAGGEVPALDLATGEMNGFLRDADGETIVSRRGEDLLREIASSSAGGSYLQAEDADTGERLSALVRDQNGGESGAGSGIPRFVWLAGFALILLALEPLAIRRWKR